LPRRAVVPSVRRMKERLTLSHTVTRREFLSSGAQAVTLAAAGRFLVLDSHASTSASPYEPVFGKLDRFVEQYLRDMNAPGLTLALADRAGVQRVSTYGFSDVEQKLKVAPDNLFQIGSISKSFVALCLLQLHDEGKLDLHKPIVEYLPSYRIDFTYTPISTHHLLTHSSGLPGIPPVYLSDPAEKHRAAYAPGAHFHYCNTAFTALGYLLWTLDGRPIGEALRHRIFVPLEMTQSEPVITLEIRERIAKNYSAFKSDRPYPRYGRLSEAPAIITTEGAGCIASTPRDMGLYAQMIANRGKGPNGRLISEESFALFSHPHIKSEEFGPTASYGYGIAVDKLQEHTILRHTGGMISFASALQVDIDEGVGAFASINAMQGYRPNPVAQYAIELMRAQRAARPLPEMPPHNSPLVVENAADYAGTYESTAGRALEFVAESQALYLIYEGKRVPLETLVGLVDAFSVSHPDFERFALVFGRAKADDPKSAVVEAGWGNNWFFNAKYSGAKQFETPREWEAYLGHYRNENPWVGSMRIVRRKGQLLVDGVVPLQPGEGGVFFLRDEDYSPEWIRFADIVNGKSMRLKFSGEDLWRVMAD
jgi:CubicO group peptidase (beta-lactamase class C family)